MTNTKIPRPPIDPYWEAYIGQMKARHRQSEEALAAERDVLRDALKTQIYHFEEAMNNEDCGEWYESIQDAKKLTSKSEEKPSD